MEATNNHIFLGDGRRLGYAEYGDPQGQPLIYFHGWPSSRLEARMVEPTALRQHMRIIAPDRPGFGLSDFKPGRKLADWPDDMIELANALELERFAIMGFSGGGPYAVACALKIPQRLSAAGIISGTGPADAPDAAVVCLLEMLREHPVTPTFSLALMQQFPMMPLAAGPLRQSPPSSIGCPI